MTSISAGSANRSPAPKMESRNDDDLADKVLSILKGRDILVKRDAITSALEDPITGSKNAEWVSQHLHADTLLSREELTLYVNLQCNSLLMIYHSPPR